MITKEYIEEQYKLAVLDYKSAWNEEEQLIALNTMSSLEDAAAEFFGVDYSENLHQLLIECKTKEYK
jgi:hypothetical protein